MNNLYRIHPRHVWVSANEHRHCSVTLRETFHIVRHAPSQREMCV